MERMLCGNFDIISDHFRPKCAFRKLHTTPHTHCHPYSSTGYIDATYGDLNTAPPFPV